jgi:hypothetical protein
LKSGVGRGWRPRQTRTRNRPRPSPRKQHLTESRIVSRLRRSLRIRRIRPLLMWHHLQGAEFFRASSPTRRYVVRSKTLHQHRQNPPLLRRRQSGGIKHPNRLGTRASCLTRTRRWLTDCRPRLVKRPTCNQMKGQAFRQGRDDRAKSSCRRLRRSGAERKGKTKRQDRDFSRRRRGQAFASRPTIRDRTDSPATLPSRVADRSPQGRKRTIVARYVFGDELKPGERWKRRLLSSR